MAEITSSAPPQQTREPTANFFRECIQATEIDTRLLGMVLALLIVWLGFQFMSGQGANPIDRFLSGVFLTPRNLWNLSVQTSAVAVMATGMVLVIVARDIDLSVGSLVGTIGMVMAAIQVEVIPDYLGFDHPLTWIITLAIGIALGALIGGLQGFIVAYFNVPAFIVTLGGLLVWRGAAWWVAQGRTIAPLDTNFQLLGGGAYGSVGATWSWIIGAVACVGIVLAILNGRRNRRRFDFPLRPLWAEVFIAGIGCAAALGAVAIVNSYPWPEGLAHDYADAHGITWDPDHPLLIPLGIAIPVLIALGAAVAMTFLSTRTRFGRYVYAFGGNPEAIELGGVNTRWIRMKIFILMGMLCAVSSAISSARLNAGTNQLGTQQELYVIAATVIGGTSFSGGIGTIPGAILGALVMQSLQSGMQLMDVDSPLQNIVVGIVLVFAVGIDTVYRRRTA
jgi:D-xylose transport system permease protein